MSPVDLPATGLPSIWTGPIVGCIRPITLSATTKSPHDSSGWSAGSTTAARDAVSLGRFARLTTSGTLPSASAKPLFGGIVNTGFTSVRIRTSISPLPIASVNASMSAYELVFPTPASPPKRTSFGTAPRAMLSSAMAICVSVAFDPVASTPPPSATALFEAAASCASRLIVSAGTPDAVATAARSTPPTTPRRSGPPGAAEPSSTMTFSIASASMPSVPGRVPHPLVGIGAGHGQTRLDLDRRARAPVHERRASARTRRCW